MFKYIADHPLAGVFLAALIVLTVIVWIKAIASGRKRNEEREKIIRQIEEEKCFKK